jgi:hypothetical protein
MHQAVTNAMRKIRPIASKNQDHPLLDYLLESTPSKLKNNFMLFAKSLSKKFEPRRFELLSISEIGPCHTCRTLTSRWEPWTCSIER